MSIPAEGPANFEGSACKRSPQNWLDLGKLPTFSALQDPHFSVTLLLKLFVRYQGDEAAVSIDDGSIFEGSLPPKQLKMVQAWIEIHKEELLVDWELAVNGDEPFRIAPLQ